VRAGIALALGILIGLSAGPAAAAGGDARHDGGGAARIIPAPASLQLRHGDFALTRETRIVAASRSAGVAQVASYLADILRPSTGYPLPVSDQRRSGRRDAIVLELGPSARPGPEAYRLDVSRHRVRLRARTAEGLFRGVQTLRQLLPARVESATTQPGPWTVPAVRVEDRPRFAWRGAHLDVARHFFTVQEVKRYIELISIYKVNRLHLHLSDDQGWRIVIDSWPRLATFGGSTEVGGGPGGYYTKADYSEIVRYAGAHHITVVPEIDTPGHTNAALASYAELNCDGKAPPLYTGIEVGFSSLCTTKELTYDFLDDVIGELAALTPGLYLHLGGDEAHSTRPEDYVRFIERVQELVHAHGKRLMGWEEIVRAGVSRDSIAQHWSPAAGSAPGTELAREAVRQGVKLVMSPANHAYLDMQYDPSTPLGLHWAGYVEARDAYEWDPATIVDGVGEADVAGVESALWSETLEDIDDIEFMAFPRLPGIAEIGWSPMRGRAWDEYRLRLAAQGPRWEALSVDFYRSPQVPWPE
jgi:hexosaminidase